MVSRTSKLIPFTVCCGVNAKGTDEKVQWAPPSALRRFDVILVDESSHYDNQEWKRLAQAVSEQPHLPYLATVADFQQLQPNVSGGLREKIMAHWPRITLDTVCRNKDPQQLLFLNRIRGRQPTRQARTCKQAPN